MNKTPRQIIQALKKIKGIKILDQRNYILAQTSFFNIRIIEKDCQLVGEVGERKWIVHFGYRPTFDRWANSTNFETEIWYSPKKNERFKVGKFAGKRMPQYTIPNLKKEMEWCKKVAQSNLFDLNSYLAVIKTPWFIYS